MIDPRAAYKYEVNIRKNVSICDGNFESTNAIQQFELHVGRVLRRFLENVPPRHVFCQGRAARLYQRRDCRRLEMQ
jgi:hypothetical protein